MNAQEARNQSRKFNKVYISIQREIENQVSEGKMSCDGSVYDASQLEIDIATELLEAERFKVRFSPHDYRGDEWDFEVSWAEDVEDEDITRNFGYR